MTRWPEELAIDSRDGRRPGSWPGSTTLHHRAMFWARPLELRVLDALDRDDDARLESETRRPRAAGTAGGKHEGSSARARTSQGPRSRSRPDAAWPLQARLDRSPRSCATRFPTCLEPDTSPISAGPDTRSAASRGLRNRCIAYLELRTTSTTSFRSRTESGDGRAQVRGQVHSRGRRVRATAWSSVGSYNDAPYEARTSGSVGLEQYHVAYDLSTWNRAAADYFVTVPVTLPRNRQRRQVPPQGHGPVT